MYIPNGTIDDFMEAWEKQGVERLDIEFYDKGYSQLQSGIENRKLMAGVFLVSGCMLAVMILCFFSNLFITGQQERIAVERLLGRTKQQCALSILTGLFVLARRRGACRDGRPQAAPWRLRKVQRNLTPPSAIPSLTPGMGKRRKSRRPDKITVRKQPRWPEAY